MFRPVLAAVVGVAVVAAFGTARGVAGPAPSAAPAGGAAPAPGLSRLLGFAGATLVGVDPRSLRPLPGSRIPVGSGGCAPRQGGSACWGLPPWTASPDGKLAVARNDASSLRLVDPGRMRVTANVRIDGGAIGALAWLAPGRILALQEIAGERQRLLAVDLATGRVAARRPLNGSVQRLGRTAQELVLLLAPARAIGPARIAVADQGGAVRFVRLARILAGSKLRGTGSGHRVETRLPGLAVDPQSRRAFVVDKTVVAEIDLKTFAVSYHTLARKTSFLARVRSWLEPAAAAKQMSGHVREARWLGGNRIGISGSDTVQGKTQAAGLLVADVRDWSVRTIDRDATGFEVAGDLLLAAGTGVAAYGFDGVKRFQELDGRQAWLVQVYGGRAYVGVAGEEALRVVDLGAGSVVATRREPLPWLLLGAGGGWWDG